MRTCHTARATLAERVHPARLILATAGDLLATIAADLEGMRALRALATERHKGETSGHAQVQAMLNTAATHGDAEALRRSLDRGADLHAADAWGQTALHWAAAAPTPHNKADAVDVCLKAGAPFSHKNIAGMTPLHWAAAWGRLPAAKSLLRGGANREAVNIRKATPATLVHCISAEARGASAVAEEDGAQEADGAGDDRDGRLALLAELLDSRGLEALAKVKAANCKGEQGTAGASAPLPVATPSGGE